MIKRVFDVIVSLAGMLLFIPVMIIVSSLIRAESRGNVFYKQLRVGKNSEDFYIFKFRTMFINSDQKGLLTIKGDTRVTRVGYWLRKIKVDELPQLLNVFLGDMSLVGPRPEVRKYVNLYSAQQLKVLTVKPGITDLASVLFIRESELLCTSDVDAVYIREILPVKLKINLEYVQHRSFSKDLKILFLTFKKIISF